MLRARSPRRLLFVDPDADFLTACAALAREHGFDPDTATAETALRQLEHHPYGVVALDLELLAPDGTPLVEDICAQYPGTTLVAVTRRAGLERPRSHRVDTAIATIVLRPFEPAELATALSDAYDLHERRSRHRAASLDQARVLLVEDNEGDAELVTEYLSEIWGAMVSRATRVEDAARAIRDYTFHFILSDLTLPDARGLDAVRRLQPLAPDTPFIVLTGIDDEDLALQAVQQGAQDYLVKGQFDASSLRRTLRHARERKQVYNRLLHLARHDPLTGAANRAALRERIDRALARGRRRDLSFAVMYVDLDRFKAINDTCGHEVGDSVLCEVAVRLHQAVRTTDLVARLGGDEFAVLLEDLESSTCPYEVAERIRTSLEQPIVVEGHKLVVTASVGIALYPEIGGSIEDILKAADAAMYLAKRRGRNNVQLSGAVPAEIRARLAIAADLQHALERGELALHFQPQYTVDRQRVVAFEALLRWNRHGGVQVPPAEFIPMLEQNGRIIAVGEWVLERACEQLAGWRAEGWTDLRVAVNLSARQIAQAGLIDCVRRCARRFDVPTACIELELTESMLMGDIQQATAILAELRALGVRLAIDDFGTGYSSLAYLSRFAVDCLKIDRSFIHDVNSDRERALITSAIVTLGHHLGLQVVAEGVETQEQLDFLTANRCDLVQGYLLARPAEAASFRDAGRA
ncbi:MAG TPA: EAL domain-containing protein [Kofleriaceae bacterium]|nr:EAL domain-containing protein [Kofleriaceae bacterium]